LRNASISLAYLKSQILYKNLNILLSLYLNKVNMSQNTESINHTENAEIKVVNSKTIEETLNEEAKLVDLLESVNEPSVEQVANTEIVITGHDSVYFSDTLSSLHLSGVSAISSTVTIEEKQPVQVEQPVEPVQAEQPVEEKQQVEPDNDDLSALKSIEPVIESVEATSVVAAAKASVEAEEELQEQQEQQENDSEEEQPDDEKEDASEEEAEEQEQDQEEESNEFSGPSEEDENEKLNLYILNVQRPNNNEIPSIITNLTLIICVLHLLRLFFTVCDYVSCDTKCNHKTL
jgi:hypothetical protein